MNCAITSNRRVSSDPSMKTFDDAVAYLYSFVSYEQKSDWSYNDKTLNLKRYHEFLSALGSPQMRLPIIHVAGSDGKGSTCAMLASVLEVAGYRVGVYQSPHLQHVRERIQINRACIPESDFTRLTGQLKESVEQQRHQAHGYATFFELMTAMAFLYFLEQNVDAVILETGLGGRLDATNVADPKVTVITRISLEHTHLLGDTLEKIADEKLGIARANTPMVIGPQEETLLPHFHTRLNDHPATVCFVQNEIRKTMHEDTPGHQHVELQTSTECYEIALVMHGAYQADNAATALAALLLWNRECPVRAVTHEHIIRGLGAARIPGRFEVIPLQSSRRIVLDVAHTVRGAHALRESLTRLDAGGNVTFVIGVLRDKPVAEMIHALYRTGDTVVITTTPSPRGMPVPQILRAIQDYQPPPEAIENPVEALQHAMETTSDSTIVVCGSLYLVGELRSWLEKQGMVQAQD